MARHDPRLEKPMEFVCSDKYGKKHKMRNRRHDRAQNGTTSAETQVGPSPVCHDCRRKIRERDPSGKLTDETRPSIVLDGIIRSKSRKQRKSTGCIDSSCHPCERTTHSGFDFTKEITFPLRDFFGVNADPTVFPSMTNFNSTLRNILGLKHCKVQKRPTLISENFGTNMKWNESVFSVPSSKTTQEVSSQTDRKSSKINKKKLLKESEFINEVVRRCLWQIGSTVPLERTARWFDANKIANDISKQCFGDHDKSSDIFTRIKANGPDKINQAYDCEPIKPLFLTEPGPVYQVMVTEKRDEAPYQEATPSPRNRTICLCDDDPQTSKYHTIEDAKYKKMVLQLVDLLEGLYSEQACCECDDDDSEAKGIRRAGSHEFDGLSSSESEGNSPGGSGNVSRGQLSGGKVKSQDGYPSQEFPTKSNSGAKNDNVAIKCGKSCFLKELFELYVESTIRRNETKSEANRTTPLTKKPSSLKGQPDHNPKPRQGRNDNEKPKNGVEEECQAPCSTKKRATMV